MSYALHGATIPHSNVVSDLHVARHAGYKAVELHLPKLFRYLDAGYSPGELAEQLDDLDVTMLDVLLPIDSGQLHVQQQLRADCERAAAAAAQLRCPAIQVVGLARYGASDWPAHRRRLVASLSGLADIAIAYGVRLAVEPVVFSTWHDLDHVLDVVHEVGTDRVGLCLDTWHLWTTQTPLHEVAALDASLILAVQISDTGPMLGSQWADADRRELPGEGILPLDEVLDAILAAGYTGPLTLEMLSPRHQEWEPSDLALAMIHRARPIVAAARKRHAAS